VAYVAGTTHALNAVADGLRLPLEFSPSSRNPVVTVPNDEEAPPEVKAIFDEIRAFYAMNRVPAVFRWMARDAIFAQGYWAAVREAFTDRKLPRPSRSSSSSTQSRRSLTPCSCNQTSIQGARPRSRRWIEQGIDDRTLRDGPAVAPSRHLLQRALDLTEVGDLSPDVVEVVDSDALHVRARVAATVHQPQERPYLVQREPELTGPADEAQAPGLHVAVQAMAAPAPWGWRHQPDSLVIADRLDVAAGSLRQGADAAPGRSGRSRHDGLHSNRLNL